MTKNKQIEEMTKHCPFYEDGNCTLCEELWVECDTKCDMCEFAKQLYTAGYRKASDVAREIIDEIFKILDAEYRNYNTQALSDTLNKMYMSSRNTVIKITAELVELKKKYTEEVK